MLKNYVLWALGSDLRAQEIIERSANKQGEIATHDIITLRHIAAGAAHKGDFKLAENCMSRILEKLSPESSIREQYLSYQLYFLFLLNEKEQAQKVKDEYILAQKNNPGFRQNNIETYWQWLNQQSGEESSLDF